MSTSANIDASICFDLNNNPEAYQCGDRYPFKTNPGPCARCAFLRDASDDKERTKQEVCLNLAYLLDLLTFSLIF